MNMTGRKRSRQLNNSGSTLVTTMVAMLFLIVLGTIILGVSAANFETKASDRQSKLDFYENEQALDDIYNGREISRSKLNYYTRSIRPYVAKIYGW